ncbi:uncharacterized protein LOC126815248 isoform X2 [Patella vulgata]|uniref:uncharacterized protein LOC126815248 isoform X2 n=1 Tax=Patella vulgata TaxID=6465 RepID=UPI00218001DF|nr:uncharacterized protein LOC126815248 isoform X2 [Patella vulgata]
MVCNSLTLVTVLASALTLQSCCGQTVLKAYFNMAGVQGEVELTKDPSSSDAIAKFNLNQGIYNYQFNKYFMNYDTTDKCASSGEGTGKGGSGTNGGSGVVQTEQIPVALSGLNSVEGATLQVTSSTDPSFKACATLMSTTKYETAVATFEDKVYGNVYFRKAVDSGNTIIYSDLYFGDSTKTKTGYKWRIQQDCLKGGSLFNPNSSLGSGCSNTDHTKCIIGDLTSKLGTVNVGSVKASANKRYLDANLPLLSANSVVGSHLVLLDDNNDVFYCTTITSVPARSLVAAFSRDGVKGHISFQQSSMFDRTRIEVSLMNLQSKASGYHVHKFPVPQRVNKDQGMCSGALVSGHFNPYSIDISGSPPSGTGTNDKYEIGDVSGKFGTLAGKDNVTMTYNDWNMPLFGKNSIAFRSLVIHKGDGSRWICANIEDVDAVKTAMATFTYPFIGYAILKQPLKSSRQETSIFIELNTADGTTTSSSYKWQINKNMAGADWNADTSRCASTGNIFNPDNSTVTGTQYDAQCQMNDPVRCVKGDLTKKHGQISVRSADNTAAEHSISDQYLPLYGSMGIIGRSIVIFGDNGIMACATIYEVRERVAVVNSWSKGVTGSIKFSQSSGVVEGKTTIKNDLQNLANTAAKYHVHTFGILPGASSSCSAASVAGHFNPFDIDTATDPEPTVGTVDQYEVGDISGKFGKLSGVSSNDEHFDTNMNLFGPQSIIGRSVVLHKASDGSRWSCGNIVEDISLTGGTLFQAKAEFDTNVRGYVTLSQYVYPDNSMSDTSVEVDLVYSDGSASTPDHNWHVHVKGVDGDDQATTGRCQSTGGHFNPFKVNLQTGYSECGATNPLRCEVGDQSNKLGTYTIGSGRMFTTDVYLPLSGMYSVIGKAVVFHEKNKGAGRIACATLMPVGTPTPLKLSIVTPANIDRAQISRTIAQEMQISEWNVMIMALTSTKEGCTDLQVYFLGMDAQKYKSKSMTMAASGDFSIAKPSKCSLTGGSDRITFTFYLLAFLTVVARYSL